MTAESSVPLKPGQSLELCNIPGLWILPPANPCHCPPRPALCGREQAHSLHHTTGWCNTQERMRSLWSHPSQCGQTIYFSKRHDWKETLIVICPTNVWASSVERGWPLWLALLFLLSELLLLFLSPKILLGPLPPPGPCPLGPTYLSNLDAWFLFHPYISSGSHNEVPQAVLNDKRLFPTVLEIGSPFYHLFISAGCQSLDTSNVLPLSCIPRFRGWNPEVRKLVWVLVWILFQSVGTAFSWHCHMVKWTHGFSVFLF